MNVYLGFIAFAFTVGFVGGFLAVVEEIQRHRQNRLGQSRPSLDRLADPTPLPGEEWSL